MWRLLKFPHWPLVGRSSSPRATTIHTSSGVSKTSPIYVLNLEPVIEFESIIPTWKDGVLPLTLYRLSKIGCEGQNRTDFVLQVMSLWRYLTFPLATYKHNITRIVTLCLPLFTNLFIKHSLLRR